MQCLFAMPVLSSIQELLENLWRGSINVTVWLLVWSMVLLWLQRRSIHSSRPCHKLVPGNVGPLVVRGALCTQQLNVLWHSECTLAGCVHRGMLTKAIQNCVHHSEPGFSEPSCVSSVCQRCSRGCQFSRWVIVYRHYVIQRQNTFLFNMKCTYMLKIANKALFIYLFINFLNVYNNCRVYYVPDVTG